MMIFAPFVGWRTAAIRPSLGAGGVSVTSTAHDELDIDALRARYDAERQQRLRVDGNAQYVAMEGRFDSYLDDPWATAAPDRGVIDETTDVLIVGGGFGGMLCAAQLRSAGFEDIRIVERAGDFGGTWYWNRYPGAACDTESYVYLPLLEETGYIPKRKYAPAPEIFEHCQRIGRHFGLYERTLFQTVVVDMHWQDAAAYWLAKTDRGDTIGARFVVLAGGPLNRPKLPGIPGIERFGGHSFHTSRWDYDYTGAAGTGNLAGLADKRVGVIGTGATAIQCVPHLGRAAKELYVFQRTPSLVAVRNDRPTDEAWAATLQPGWQRERMDNFTAVISGGAFDEDLVQDGWTDLLGGILLAPRRLGRPLAPGEAAHIIEEADFRKMEEVRDRVDSIVEDPATASALKPWYKAFCKRPCFHDEYLDTFNRPNVYLVDTQGRGVERITERGVVVAGREYELDCLIYATGFEVGRDVTRRLGFEVHGRDGVTLSDKWRDGATTLHGFLTRGLPNCLFASGTQSGQSANFVHIIDEQSKHIAYLIDQARRRGARTIEPTAEAEQAWTQEVVASARGRQAYQADCTPGYYNNEGNVDSVAPANGAYWRGPTAFIRLLDQWRRDGQLQGIELGSKRS
jgi:cyclohexanone monooxygenase